MSPVALMLVLSSAFLHALWNALLKRQEDPEAGVVGVTSVAVLAGGLWTLGLKGQAFPTWTGFAWGLAAGLWEGVYLATLARSLRHAPLGLAYTVARGGALLLVWPVSVLWLGEVVTPWAAAGAGVLGLGLVVMGLSRPSGPVGVGLMWAAVSGVAIAGYHVAYKYALAEKAQAPALFTLALGLALPMLVFSRRKRLGAVREQVRRTPGLVGVAGVLSTVSFGLMLVALSSSGAGAVLTLRNTSIAFALALSALQGERLARKQWMGAALVLGGAVLLGWPRR